jgi:hypothetical protein
VVVLQEEQAETLDQLVEMEPMHQVQPVQAVADA